MPKQFAANIIERNIWRNVLIIMAKLYRRSLFRRINTFITIAQPSNNITLPVELESEKAMWKMVNNCKTFLLVAVASLRRSCAWNEWWCLMKLATVSINVGNSSHNDIRSSFLWSYGGHGELAFLEQFHLQLLLGYYHGNIIWTVITCNRIPL